MTGDCALRRWTAAMCAGDFESAWKVTDSIEELRPAPDPRHLVWDGTPVENRRVVVRCRHGLGDSVQFLRYLPALRRRASAVFVDLQPELLGLFEGMQGVDAFVDGRDRGGEVEIESMELPYLFRTSQSTIPSEVPYLPGRIRSEPRAFVPREGSFHVGIIWSSGEWNPARSIPLALLGPLACVPGIRLHSLQQGPGLVELSAAQFPVEPLSTSTRSIHLAAAAMQDLDLMITVDTMGAHLAGALARPVWTLLPYDADWRWMRDREDSPWYPTMRLFRQPAPGAWQDVADRVASELRQLV